MEKNIIKEIAKKVTSSVLSSDPYEWPPSCIVFTYQPVRPEPKNVQGDNTHASENKDGN